MLINIMVTTMAADPAVALEPRDHLVPVGFRLRHGHPIMRKYMRIKTTVNTWCGRCSLMPEILGIRKSEELPQGLFGSARANALEIVDQRYNYKTLIIADLSFDPTYAETLFERFGPRVIGLQIGATGDGLVADPLQINNKMMLRYRVGRTYLLDFLLRELTNGKVQILPGEASVRALRAVNGARNGDQTERHTL